MISPPLDKYIEKSESFAQPILIHLSKLVLENCPQVEVKLKWSFPCFIYKGNILCSVAAFKHHCSFGFWLGSVMDDPAGILHREEKNGMGNLGKLKRIEDLPPSEILVSYIYQAMQLIDDGVKLKKAKSPAEKTVSEIPEDLLEALKAAPKAMATFERFSASNKKEYIEWVVSAKTEKTRQSRINTTLEWLSEGKIRYWKYGN